MYVFTEEPPLGCPIMAMSGSQDELTPRPDLAAWRDHTRASFEERILPGGHFFLQTHRPLLLQLLASYLESVQPA
jgi:surfactin synthase thioesterase subunit